MLRFDEETARRIEALYTTPDVVAQRREVLDLLGLRPGERVVDVGAGPGFLAAEMAAAVGPSGRVHAVDPSESMRLLARGRGAGVDVVDGSAESLPLAAASVDVAVSTQVLEYVTDVPRALAEMRRVLRPGGRALVLDTDWDSIVWHCADPARMRRVLAAWQEHLVDPHLPRTLAGALRAAGFSVEPPRVVVLINTGPDRDTFSAALAPIVSSFVAGRRGLRDDEVRAWAEELADPGEATFFSINRYLFRATVDVPAAGVEPALART